MSRWFRFYDGAVDDPKVQRLPPVLFKFWVNSLCLASRNGGEMPAVVDMAFSLRMTEKQVVSNLKLLVDAGLVDEVDGKSTPHNWNARQFKSDDSGERVKRHRQRQVKQPDPVTDTVTRNADVTADVTPPEQNRAEAESEQNRDSVAVAPPVSSKGDDFRLEPEIPAFLIRKTKKPEPVAIPEWIPTEQWAAFVEMRKKIKHPLTDYAMKLAFGELDKLRKQGHAPAAVLDHCILKNYRGIFPPPAGAAASISNGTAAIPSNLEALQAEEDRIRQQREQGNVH